MNREELKIKQAKEYLEREKAIDAEKSRLSNIMTKIKFKLWNYTNEDKQQVNIFGVTSFLSESENQITLTVDKRFSTLAKKYSTMIRECGVDNIKII